MPGSQYYNTQNNLTASLKVAKKVDAPKIRPVIKKVKKVGKVAKISQKS